MIPKQDQSQAWVAPFYQTQNRWLGAYLRPLEEQDQERANTLLKRSQSPPPQKLLELGGGGGQTLYELCRLGYQCQMVELLAESVLHARQLCQNLPKEQQPLIHCADFYTWQTQEKFDLIAYWDSFGIGSDQAQQELLLRMKSWLQPQGRIWIEIGAQPYWSQTAKGQQYDLGDFYRQHDFNHQTQQLLDHWWPKNQTQDKITQYLRCYQIQEWKDLLHKLGFQVLDLWPGGKVDYHNQTFIPQASLEDCMTFYSLISIAPH